MNQSGATVRGLSLSRWTSSDNKSGIAFLSESEWKALSRCRRLWAAMALDTLLKGQSSSMEISKIYGCEIAELEDLQRGAKTNAGRVQRFCSEVGWAPLERLINDFKINLGSSVQKELQSLMTVPYMTSKIAKVLFDTGKITCSLDLSLASESTVVRWIHLSIGFQKQLLAEIDIDIEIEDDTVQEIEVEILNVKTHEDVTAEEMNVEVTAKCSRAILNIQEPIEQEVKISLARTRDEEILFRLTAYVSCLIRGARLVIYLCSDDCINL